MIDFGQRTDRWFGGEVEMKGGSDYKKYSIKNFGGGWNCSKSWLWWCLSKSICLIICIKLHQKEKKVYYMIFKKYY